VQPVLDYEREEAEILQAAARPSIGLTVEESGCLEELGYLVNANGQRYFDVVHLTGHGTLQNDEPRFITETATGEANYASARDIARALKLLPPLLFLSGCHTGQEPDAVPSMAEQLLQFGAKAVLGWGREVLDTDAIVTAAALYDGLSSGQSLIAAMASTYQELIKKNRRDWHLLRLYVGRELPGALVLPERTPGWRRAERASMATEFLDSRTKKIKVPTRESFVGRRRQ
jgi:CHAT domain